MSIVPSLTAMSPPHAEAKHEASVEQAEEDEDADQVGEDVSDTHVKSPQLRMTKQKAGAHIFRRFRVMNK